MNVGRQHQLRADRSWMRRDVSSFNTDGCRRNKLKNGLTILMLIGRFSNDSAANLTGCAATSSVIWDIKWTNAVSLTRRHWQRNFVFTGAIVWRNPSLIRKALPMDGGLDKPKWILTERHVEQTFSRYFYVTTLADRNYNIKKQVINND